MFRFRCSRRKSRRETLRLVRRITSGFPRVASLVCISGRGKGSAVGSLRLVLFGNGSRVFRLVRSLGFGMNPGDFCRAGARRTCRLCYITHRFTGLAKGRLICSLCANAKAVTGFITRGTGGIVNVRCIPRTVRSTGIGSRVGGVRGALFCTNSVGSVLAGSFVTRRNHPSIVVASPPHTNVRPSMIGIVLGTTPGHVMCMDYGPTARTHSLRLVSSRCGITTIRPMSVFPRAPRMRGIILLRGHDSTRVGRGGGRHERQRGTVTRTGTTGRTRGLTLGTTGTRSLATRRLTTGGWAWGRGEGGVGGNVVLTLVTLAAISTDTRGGRAVRLPS